jgi:hypothetical protein
MSFEFLYLGEFKVTSERNEILGMNQENSWVLLMKEPEVKMARYCPFKGIVSRDFLPPFFFVKLILLGP